MSQVFGPAMDARLGARVEPDAQRAYDRAILELQALQVTARLGTFVDEVQLEKLSRACRSTCTSRTALVSSADSAVIASPARGELRATPMIVNGIQLVGSDPQANIPSSDDWPQEQQLRVERL